MHLPLSPPVYTLTALSRLVSYCIRLSSLKREGHDGESARKSEIAAARAQLGAVKPHNDTLPISTCRFTFTHIPPRISSHVTLCMPFVRLPPRRPFLESGRFRGESIWKVRRGESSRLFRPSPDFERFLDNFETAPNEPASSVVPDTHWFCGESCGRS